MARRLYLLALCFAILGITSGPAHAQSIPSKTFSCANVTQCANTFDTIEAWTVMSPRLGQNLAAARAFLTGESQLSCELTVFADGTFQGSCSGDGFVVVFLIESVILQLAPPGGLHVMYDQGTFAPGPGAFRTSSEFADYLCQHFGRACGGSPIVVDLGAPGYALSGLADPVEFDLDADGTPDTISWTARGSQDAFLVLDRNGNGVVDDGSELFGDAVTLSDGSISTDGYVALAELDSRGHGGNGNGFIDRGDIGYWRLQLWTDANHNGRSAPGELVSLHSRGVVAISLAISEPMQFDAHGNLLAFSSPAQVFRAGRLQTVMTADVFFMGE